MAGDATISAGRILVVMPNWLGDAVMATPFLRAVRGLYPEGRIAALVRPLCEAVVSGLPFVDEMIALDKTDMRGTMRRVREGRFEVAVLLPNSFRSAMMVFRAGIPNRVGYAREMRSMLLTHRLAAVKRTGIQTALDEKKAAFILAQGGGKVKVGSGYQPVPTVEYYLKLAEFLGAQGASKKMELGVTEAERVEADSVLEEIVRRSASGVRRFCVMVPGANFGASKCWPAEYFAEVAAGLIGEGMDVVIASSPKEMPVVEAILENVGRRTADAERYVCALAKLNEGKGVSLGALKEIVRRAAVMVCNDTGPRHFAAAFGVPTVTVFGPTDPVWAETFVREERQVRLSTVPCSPCQLKVCPIDHRCMRELTPDIVMGQVRAILSSSSQGV